MRYMEIIRETASSGATGAASVATVVGGLGAGFDASEDGYKRGVYGKPSKPLMIRRTPEQKIEVEHPKKT